MGHVTVSLIDFRRVNDSLVQTEQQLAGHTVQQQLTFPSYSHQCYIVINSEVPWNKLCCNNQQSNKLSLLLKWRKSEECVLGFSAGMVKGESQATLILKLIRLLGTWGLQSLRSQLSLPIVFQPTFNKAFWRYCMWHVSAYAICPITTDTNLTWEIRYDRHTNPLRVCIIQL